VPEKPQVASDAAAFGRLFEQTYLRFHRRDAKRSQLSGASRAVLLHLAMSGPLTVGEAARHLDRAKGLLERQADPCDRRRTLVWLTPQGLQRLDDDREVLGRELLERAMAEMPAGDRASLLAGLRALLAADDHAVAVTTATVDDLALIKESTTITTTTDPKETP